MLKQCPNDVKLVHRATNREITIDNGEEMHDSDGDVEDHRSDFIPRALQRRAERGSHKVWVTELWIIGILSNINSIIIRPDGYSKPFSIKVGRASAQSSNRFWEARFAHSLYGDFQGEVMFRPRSKGDPLYRNCKRQHFATVVSFNPDLGLNGKSKFDICVDKDDWTYHLRPYIFERDFAGALPTRIDGSNIDVAIGVGKDWYSLPLQHPSGSEQVKLAGHRGMTAGIKVKAKSISINSGLRLKLRAFHRQELVYDPVMTFDGHHAPGRPGPAPGRPPGGSGDSDSESSDSGNDGRGGGGGSNDSSDSENDGRGNASINESFPSDSDDDTGSGAGKKPSRRRKRMITDGYIHTS